MPQISIPSLLNIQEPVEINYTNYASSRSSSITSLIFSSSSSTSTLVSSTSDESSSPILSEFPLSSPVKKVNISNLLNCSSSDDINVVTSTIDSDMSTDNSDNEYTYRSKNTKQIRRISSSKNLSKVEKTLKTKKSYKKLITTTINQNQLPLNLAKSKNYSIKSITSVSNSMVNGSSYSLNCSTFPNPSDISNFSSDINQAKNQGRPYTNYLQARFYLHEDMNSLFCYLIRKTSFQYTNFKIPLMNTLSAKNSSKRKNVIIQAENSAVSKAFSVNKMSPICKSIIFESSDGEESIKILEKLTNVFQLNHLHNTSTNLNQHTIAGNRIIGETFKFVKVVRDVHGKLIKLETIRCPSDLDEEFDCTWIKRNVCYPRYKAKMKIHLIKCPVYANDLRLSSDSFVLDNKKIIYNEEKMFSWDFENDILDFDEVNDISIVR